MMTFNKSLETCLKNKYATMSGRASRAEFWWFQLFIFFIDVLIIAIANLSNSEEQKVLFLIVYLLFSAVTLIPYLCVFVRRLHDIGYSGYFLWLVLLFNIIPIIVGLIVNIFPGEKGTNEYGANPLEQLKDDSPLTSNLDKVDSKGDNTKDEQTEGITDVDL